MYEGEESGPNLPAAFQQCCYLRKEIGLLINKKWWRYFTIWFSRSIGPVIHYRIDRALALALGRSYGLLRPFFFPLRLFLRLFGRPCEIHYRAEIGPGLRILHPSLGCVISGAAVIGKNCTLVGGNCIGGRNPVRHGDIRVGDSLLMGANAVLLGPVSVGDDVRIGANAVVTKNLPDGRRVICLCEIIEVT
jgi:serine acetyltransferase